MESKWSYIVDTKKNGKKYKKCWYFNNGGCKNSDGTLKKESECNYIHEYNTPSESPSIEDDCNSNELTNGHNYTALKRNFSNSNILQGTLKPCDRYNLEGFCKWIEYCKYSHRVLSEDEWKQYYPDIPYNLLLNSQKRQVLENMLSDMDCRIKILEYKLECIDSKLKD
jgi:hypothetical protein